ncbi:hypothetical protein BC941DRAFT_471724 [Chlamydoabsidia padenii]|nr:hypothetical protein BC941DRAFT_471724 [Chlamydoabsidia padenii]
MSTYRNQSCYYCRQYYNQMIEYSLEHGNDGLLVECPQQCGRWYNASFLRFPPANAYHPKRRKTKEKRQSIPPPFRKGTPLPPGEGPLGKKKLSSHPDFSNYTFPEQSSYHPDFSNYTFPEQSSSPIGLKEEQWTISGGNNNQGPIVVPMQYSNPEFHERPPSVHQDDIRELRQEIKEMILDHRAKLAELDSSYSKLAKQVKRDIKSIGERYKAQARQIEILSSRTERTGFKTWFKKNLYIHCI